jgi:raffinose/stachyose/melibiose transport system permease protein
LVLVAPGLGIYVVFAIVPIGIALVYSLTDWTGISRNVDFIGLDNYATLLADPEVHRAFIVTFVVATAATLILNVLAIPLAALLSGNTITNRLYRMAIFFPLVLSPIVVGFLWQSILNSYGLLNGLLGDLGVRPIPFLAEPGPAVASVAFVTIWQALGFTTILYLAALRTIPDEIYEAATMDGAGPIDRFRRITVPLLAPAVTVNVVLLMIFFMRLYEYVLVMTQGGPVRSTQTVAYLLVANAFERSKYGYGSAIAIVMLVVVGVISVALVAVLRRREQALS